MGGNEKIRNLRDNLPKRFNPNNIDAKFGGVINKRDLSSRILKGNLGRFIGKLKQDNPNSIRLKKGMEMFGIGKERQQETKEAIKGLLNLKTGPILTNSSRYNQVLNSLRKILNNNKLGFPNQLIGYTGIGVLNNGNQVSINLQRMEDVGTTNGIRIYINKGNNRFSVIKDGQTIGAGRF